MLAAHGFFKWLFLADRTSKSVFGAVFHADAFYSSWRTTDFHSFIIGRIHSRNAKVLPPFRETIHLQVPFPGDGRWIDDLQQKYIGAGC